MALEKFGVRTLITIVFAPLILLSAWQGGYIFLAVILSLIILAMYEFYAMAAAKLTVPMSYLGIGTGIVVCFLAFFQQMAYLWILLAAAFCLATIYELFRNAVAPILNIATTFMGVLYVAFLLSFLILIRELPRQAGLDYRVGGLWVILVFAAIWLCDTAAYILGAWFGRRKLMERVSPGKTLEGTVAGFLVAVLTAYGLHAIFPEELPLLHALVLGAICGTAGQLSDLTESLLKRDVGVKDSSNLIPGHGGILDRFDSELLAAPAVYFYLHFVVF